MNKRRLNVLARWWVCALVAFPTFGAERKIVLSGLPVDLANPKVQRLGPLEPTRQMNLAIGLPLRNKPLLTNMLHQVYNRGSTNFHRYLTPAQFSALFSPTETDYASVKGFAESNRLKVAATYSNRAVLDVVGQISDIERAFQVHLGKYEDTVEGRQFYAPDREPSVESHLPVLYVGGLDNYNFRRRNVRLAPEASPRSRPYIRNGSGSACGYSGLYLGNDFRNAYVPGVTLNGSGQVIGLWEEEAYTASDITTYENLAGGGRNVPLQNHYCPGVSGVPEPPDTVEISLDIEMVIAMAPGAQEVYIVEGNTPADIINVLVDPPDSPLPMQCSTSFGDSDTPTIIQQLQQMEMQGQTFFRATGDSGASAGGITPNPDCYNDLTEVGATELSMTSGGGAWTNETVWDYQFVQGASKGEIATAMLIPDYQKAINTTANGGSAVYRNVPDVAMCGDAILCVYTTFSGDTAETGYTCAVGGTSAAAPLWAGFIALVNQQAAAQGTPTVGFLNPALYEIAQRPDYTDCFHDITVGNNTNSASSNLFLAGPGYDLCTGLGSPNGQNLINALTAMAGPVFVDFNKTGNPANPYYGTYNNPFQTLAEGTNAVSPGGTIFIKSAGSSSETMTISKPMTIIANDGAATVGGSQ